MIKMIYTISIEEKQAELEWLKDQSIFPACETCYIWPQNKICVRFGMIVSPDAALAIKLRHKLDLQEVY